VRTAAGPYDWVNVKHTLSDLLIQYMSKKFSFEKCRHSSARA